LIARGRLSSKLTLGDGGVTLCDVNFIHHRDGRKNRNEKKTDKTGVISPLMNFAVFEMLLTACYRYREYKLHFAQRFLFQFSVTFLVPRVCKTKLTTILTHGKLNHFD